MIILLIINTLLTLIKRPKQVVKLLFPLVLKGAPIKRIQICHDFWDKNPAKFEALILNKGGKVRLFPRLHPTKSPTLLPPLFSSPTHPR